MGFPLIFAEMQKEHWPWIKDRAHPILCEDTTGLVALRGRDVVAACAFDSWSGGACLGHIAIDDPFVLRRGFLECAFDFVFNYANRLVMMGLTPGDNDKALNFNRKIGMKEVYRIKDGYEPGIDYVLQEMRKDECRWLEKR